MAHYKIGMSVMPDPEDSRRITRDSDGRAHELDLANTDFRGRDSVFIAALKDAQPSWMHDPASPKAYPIGDNHVRFFADWSADPNEVDATILGLCRAQSKGCSSFEIERTGLSSRLIASTRASAS